MPPPHRFREPPAHRAAAGEDSITPLVYQQLRRLAQSYLRAERSGHTLQATALVHEAYIRLVRELPREAPPRGRFVAMAAHLMRQVLVDHARTNRREKRGGRDRLRVPLDEAMAVVAPSRADVWIALDGALERLAAFSERQARIVELRYFGGLTIDETAGILDVSPKTVGRDWQAALAWLRRELGV